MPKIVKNPVHKQKLQLQTTAEDLAGDFQPLENQRLSTTDDVSFNSAHAGKIQLTGNSIQQQATGTSPMVIQSYKNEGDIEVKYNNGLSQARAIKVDGTTGNVSFDNDISADNLSGTNTGDQSSSDFTHNDLSSLQGGTTNEYYHLTSAQHTLATGDNYVLNTGDTMSGQLFIDGGANEVQLKVQAHSTQTANIAEYQNSSGTDLVKIDKDGKLLVGTASVSGSSGNPSLYVVNSSALTSGINYGASFQMTAAPNTISTTVNVAARYGLILSGVGTSVNTNRAFDANVFHATSSYIANVDVFNASMTATGGGTIVSYRYFNVQSPFLVSGTIQNLYGLKVNDLSAGTVSNYAIYTGEGTVHIGDKLEFTQTDGNEYIDSLSDGYMDYRATTAHRFGDGTNQLNIAADGELTLEGTARVYKNQWITVAGLKAPGTKPAAYVDWGINGGFEFSDGTDDTVVTTIRLPIDMDKTVAPEFKIGWASATADPGDDSKQVVWQLEYLYVSPNEDTTASAQETLTTTTSASTTANGLTVSTITGMDLPSASDQLLVIRLKRLGADGDDDLGDDCTLVGCGLKYVADKLGVAT